jgi:pyridoxal phosphate enzyme (YggS family)
LRIAAASKRRGVEAGPVRLVCVTKGIPIGLIEEAIGLGVKDIGENRVQEAESKYRAIGSKVVWHLIGHLQTNKVKDAVKLFSLIHSVDSEKLASEIDAQARKISKVQDILVEVNISGEDGKYGITPAKVGDFIRKTVNYPNISILGLMGMAPLVNDPELARPYFRDLRCIFDKVKSEGITNVDMKYLSMGMSQDFEVAVEEGSNMVRIGSAIFKT